MKPRHLEPWVILGILLSVSYFLIPSLVSSSPDDSIILSDGEISSDEIELRFSTYLGGTDYDYVSAITIDDSGDIYIAGCTSSTDFPTTEGAYDRSHNGGSIGFYEDAFVMKLSNDGQEILYSTFIGGSDDDESVYDIAVDDEGSVYITGITTSDDFPTTPGAFDRTYNGGETDGFVAKLSPDGSELLYSTYIGGSEGDFPNALVVGSNGECYVVGVTYSEDFPIDTPNDQESCYTQSGRTDGFVFKLDENGSSIGHSMYLGGEGDWDEIFDITIDSEGNIIFVGYTQSSDFPVVNAFDDELTGHEGFITKIHPNGSFLLSTFFGGSDADDIRGVSISPSDQLYLTGLTISEDFPRVGVTDQQLNGSRGIFLSILDSQVTDIEFSCVLKDSTHESVSTSVGSIMYVSEHEVWLSGNTRDANFPVTEDALDTTMSAQKGYLTMIDPTKSTLNYSTFFGGGGLNSLIGLVMDSSANLISAGWTDSFNIPVKNALEPEKISPEHYDDGFVFSLTTAGITTSTTTSTDTSTISTIGPDLLPILTFIGIGTAAILIFVVVSVKRFR
jgi:hypothetical protein